MGSATLIDTTPQTMENNKFKPLSFIKSIFHKDKKKTRRESEIREPKPTTTIENGESTVASILEPFRKLELQNKAKEKAEAETKETVAKVDDELENFTFKVIEDDRFRTGSQSSQDSGFSDINTDVVNDLEKLTIQDRKDTKYEASQTAESKVLEVKAKTDVDNENEKHEKEENNEEGDKKKKLHNVYVKRTPIRNKIDYNAHPYTKEDNLYKPINQINQKCLSGGQLIVNQPATSELDEALQSVANIYQSNPPLWDDLLDVINKDCNTDAVEQHTFPTLDFNFEDGVSALLDPTPYPKDIFPTPPRSDVPSPLSESQTFYPSNSEYTLSPERSSPTYTSDFEKYQEITPYSYDEEEGKKDKCMTMKNYKDLQKEIANGLSKNECCDLNRKTCKEMLEEHLGKLKSVEKRNLILKVSALELKDVYGLLRHIFLSLSKESSQVDLQMALFALLCQRVMAEAPTMFVGDFGLNILKEAVLRCPQYPLLTRYIVQCVYVVLRNDPKLCGTECVFHEVDLQGDNLVIACARAGDSCALVLCELTRSDVRGSLPPLFKLHHYNSDGYNALQMACRLHSAASSRLHTVHVLLDHANADLWKGDSKGGDTALHLAVNSSSCDLRLVMVLFRNQDRKLWKKLAHAPNGSSVTPLEYARSATKSTTRQNYPPEVLEFLKKCR